jgi:hypothetical protein
MTKQGNNIEEVKRRLAQAASDFKAKTKTKLDALDPLKEQIIQLKKKGASNSEVAELITQSGMEVSKDTLRRYVANLGITKGTKKRLKRVSDTAKNDGDKIVKQSKLKAPEIEKKTPEGFNSPPKVEDL